VSVVVPVYNAARYVGQAIASAAGEPETLEVVVVEDGSEDESWNRCQEAADRHRGRVVLLRHPGGRHRGPGASRNLGIEAARGELVAFLDADDYYLAGRFRTSVAMLQIHPDLDGVYEAVAVQHEDDVSRAEWELEAPGRDLITMREGIAPERLLAALTRGGFGNFHTNGIVLRRRVFGVAGVFDIDLDLGQDMALWWRLAACGRLVGGRLDTPVAVYRRHPDSRAVLRHRDRRVRLAVAERTWRWACPRPGPRDAVRLLRSAYARALADWDPAPGETVAGLVSHHIVAAPVLALRPELWIGLLRRLARQVRSGLTARARRFTSGPR
jgi:glycosyltransferase involved in cell wall biosynthesis